MGQKQESLKKQSNSAEQGEMFALAEVQENTKEMLKAYEAKPGQFSGAIIERNKEKVDAILELLAQPDMTHKKISKIFKVSRNTVAALERRAEDDGRLAAYTQRLTNKLRYASRASLDSLIESIEKDELKGKDKGIVTGILLDHLGKLEGRPTSIVETRREMSADEFKEYMDDIMANLDEKEADVIEVTENED
tara:strand:- start:75 stop:653 length:579 start_codon:yes stop_codon:yes gene_type:complete